MYAQACLTQNMHIAVTCEKGSLSLCYASGCRMQKRRYSDTLERQRKRRKLKQVLKRDSEEPRDRQSMDTSGLSMVFEKAHGEGPYFHRHNIPMPKIYPPDPDVCWPLPSKNLREGTLNCYQSDVL